jgi:hypothetical protein
MKPVLQPSKVGVSDSADSVWKVGVSDSEYQYDYRKILTKLLNRAKLPMFPKPKTGVQGIFPIAKLAISGTRRVRIGRAYFYGSADIPSLS